MQRITYRVKVSAQGARRRISYLLRPSKRLPNTKSNIVSSVTPNPSARFAKTKKLAQVSSIALLSLPAESLTTMSAQVPAYDNVMLENTLTIAAVPGDSTYFATDGFQHGFGFDLVRSYADELGVDIDLKAYANEEAALKALRAGKADMALTTASTQLKSKLNLSSVNVSCGYDASLTKNGLHPKVSWSFNSPNDPLSQKASYFLCDSIKLENTQKLAAFYNQSLLKDAYSQDHFQKTLTEKLPDYQSSFEEQARNYNHDWELLVAMGYQESHLDANAVSPTGVRGLMMLTNNTAKAMGVSNRVDPYQSIGGGARYLEQMKADFSDVPKTDRIWFALAGYNMGPNAIKGIQRTLRNRGINDKSWANVYAYLDNNRASNSRYGQAMHYVSNIRSYLETIKTQTV
ncbi:transglycosylase SLT domain-containing protein [Psychrobacter sp. AOP22-C1-22]|uniref:transglycosylase SLT domain-containing protein n=1 Tax=unclassified Psychrobacter TaxID=196806 RepID=UPI001787FF05|nr:MULTISPECIES: transglycosylase SLT domain-containing protein [unclassified Psychrobacter]MBE0407701.1 transglycosylase SLT domain-containing protein [Psychrobacter sp. FME6]MBE0445332.1 transglycosylase SLT domain-containing protein [Psychrobacter sp. FME5]MDN5802886.1 transglycosylase SLT domain-containing protein [Psychrobacter sp.]